MMNPLPPSEAVGEPFPTQARVVVIGGGIVGASVLYHLTERGWKDVVLLERKTLTSGMRSHYPEHISQELDDRIRASFDIRLPREAMRPGNGRWS